MTIEFGNRLQELRKAKGLSQEALAEKLGVSRQAVSKWECGEASPDTDNLIELSKIYEISLDELVGNKQPEKEEKKSGSSITFTDGNKTVCLKDDDDEDEDDDEDKDEEKRHPVYTIVNIICSSVWTLGIVLAYVLLGSLLGLWGKAWVLFLLIPILPSLMDCIFYKNMNKFAYPVLVAFIYLFVCAWVPGGLWHPLWVLFLTIPPYYIIADAIKKIKNVKAK